MRATPKADADRIDGAMADAAGTVRLAVRVRAAPEKGAANAAVTGIAALGAPRSEGPVTMASSATSRQKTLYVEGDAASLSGRLQELVTP